MPIPTTEPPALRCEISQHVSGNVVSISGLVFTANAGPGTYQLRVEKSGPSGTSVLNQGGAFEAKPPNASVVGNVSFSAEAGAHYKARLRVTAGDASVECKGERDRL